MKLTCAKRDRLDEIKYDPSSRRSGSNLTRDHHVLDFRNRFGGIQALRTGLRTVHDCVAAIQSERIFQEVQPLSSGLITRVRKPAIGLQKRGRSKITVAIPPIAGARRRAASAENALVKPIKLAPIFRRLTPFFLGRWRIGLEPARSTHAARKIR